MTANTPQLGIYSFGDEYFSTTIVPSSKTGAAVFVEEDISLYEGEELELIETYLNKRGLYPDENLRLCYTFNISWDKNGRIKASDPYGDVLFGLMSATGTLGVSSIGTSGIWPHDVQSYFTAPDELLGLYQGSVTYKGKKSSVYMILYGNGEYTLYTSLKSKSYESTTGTYSLTTTGDNNDLAIAFSGLSVAEGNTLNGVVAELKGSASSMKIDFNARKSDIITDVDRLILSRKFDLNDSDRDGLSNWEEINTYGTDPLLSDTDRDGQSDAAEIEAGTDANDKSVFPASIRLTAYPASGLKLTEYYELKLYLNDELYEIYPLDKNGRLRTTIYLPTGSTYSIYATVNFKNDPANPLPPGDDFVPYTSGAPEVVELTRSTSVKLTLDGDMDGDGLLDSLEAKYKCDPTLVDTDGDGLTDAEEVQMKLKPYLADSDRDGYADNIEVALGTDPLKKNDAPVAYAEQFIEVSLQLIYTDENGAYQTQALDTAGFCELLAEIAQVDNPTGHLIIRSAFTEDEVDEIWMLTTDSGPKEINKYIFPIKVSGQRSYFTAAADEDLVTHHVAAYEIKNKRTKIGLTVIADGDYEYTVQDNGDFSVLLMKAQNTPTRISGIFEHPDLTPRDQPGILRGTFTYQGESSWFGPDYVFGDGDIGGTPPPAGSWELPVFPPVGGRGDSFSSASMNSASSNTRSIFVPSHAR